MELLHFLHGSRPSRSEATRPNRNLTNPGEPGSLAPCASIMGLNFEKYHGCAKRGSLGQDLITLLGETYGQGR